MKGTELARYLPPTQEALDRLLLDARSRGYKLGYYDGYARALTEVLGEPDPDAERRLAVEIGLEWPIAPE